MSTLPFGPCCCPRCALSVDIRCRCRCGYVGEEDIPEHHIFHPDCCTVLDTDGNLVGEQGSRPTLPMPSILQRGRSVGWRGIPETMYLSMGFGLLPEKAVLCPTCHSLYSTWNTRGIEREGSDRDSNQEKIHQRAVEIVAQHVTMLPSLVVTTLCAFLTLKFWLRGLAQRTVWRVDGFRVFQDPGSMIQTEVKFAKAPAANAGGDVLIGGPAGAIARSIAKVFQIWIINLTGASQPHADQST